MGWLVALVTVAALLAWLLAFRRAMRGGNGVHRKLLDYRITGDATAAIEAFAKAERAVNRLSEAYKRLDGSGRDARGKFRELP